MELSIVAWLVNQQNTCFWDPHWTTIPTPKRSRLPSAFCRWRPPLWNFFFFNDNEAEGKFLFLKGLNRVVESNRCHCTQKYTVLLLFTCLFLREITEIVGSTYVQQWLEEVVFFHCTRSCGFHWIYFYLQLRNTSLESKRQTVVWQALLQKAGERRQSLLQNHFYTRKKPGAR